MLTQNELETIPKALEIQFRQLENRVMSDIVRRLKSAGEMTASAEYQTGRLLSMGVSQKDIEKLIGNTLELSEKEVAKIYDDIIAKGYADDLKLIKSAGKDVLPYRDNKSLQQLISAVKTQTNDTFKNITQSLGFAVKQNGKMTFKPIADYYQKILDSAVLDITTGAFDYNTVLKRAVAEMTNSGLRTVNYATGHSDRIDVAVRRAVMTGVNQVTARITEQNMDILGTEYVEVSWHSGARPSHQEWQGKIYHWNRGKSSTNSQNTVDNSGESGIIDTKESDFKSDLAKGLINTTIEQSQQQKHQLTKVWKNQVKQAIASNGRFSPKSRLNKNIDPQELVNKYAGTGRISFNGGIVHEYIRLPFDVGVTFDKKIGKYVKTKVVQIKYTKNGVHIFPTIERSK